MDIGHNHRRTEVEGVNSTEDVSREVEKITALMFSPELKPNANISWRDERQLWDWVTREDMEEA